MPVDVPRPLNSAERAVLDLLLAADFAGAEALRAQAATATVVGGCGCGCPSVTLAVAHDAPAAGDLTSRLMPAELEVDPGPDEIILFTDDGRLSYLEYVYYGDAPPTSWPPPDRLRRRT